MIKGILSFYINVHGKTEKLIYNNTCKNRKAFIPLSYIPHIAGVYACVFARGHTLERDISGKIQKPRCMGESHIS